MITIYIVFKFFQERIRNFLTSERHGRCSSFIVGPTGIGKTVAAISAMLKRVDVGIKRLQAIFVTINYEAACQALAIAESNPFGDTAHQLQLKMELLSEEFTRPSENAQIIFGAGMHCAKTEFMNAESPSLESMRAIYFDDGDITMSSKKVREWILPTLQSSVDIVYISPFEPNYGTKAFLKPFFKFTASHEHAKTHLQHRFAVAISSEKQKFEILDEISKLDQTALALFCKVRLTIVAIVQY